MKRTTLGLIALGLAVAGAILYSFLPGAVPVETVPAASGHMEVTVVEEGKTRVIDRFVISSPVAGFARRIELDIGDPVAKEQPLVTVEPLRSTVLDPRSRAEAEARVAAAQAALQSAQEDEQAAASAAEYAQSELERIRPLFEEGFASKEVLDQDETEARRTLAAHRSAKFSVDVARFNLEAARTALRYSGAGDAGALPEKVAVRSPVDGRVLKIHRKSEGVVGAGEPLLEVGDPHALEIEVDVLSADAVNVKPGTLVRFERWGGPGVLKGQVRVVEPVGFTKISALGVEEQRVLVISALISPPQLWERLGDGYRVEAHFIVWEGDNVLHIPTSALFRHGDGWAVFMVDGSRARLRPVEVGHRSGLEAQILSGLEEKDAVITHPDDAITDGARVRVRNNA